MENADYCGSVGRGEEVGGASSGTKVEEALRQELSLAQCTIAARDAEIATLQAQVTFGD